MQNLFLKLNLLLLLSDPTFACDIVWKKTASLVPFRQIKASPQGLTYFKDNIVLTNHYKHSGELKPSDLMFLEKDTFKLKRKFSFPAGYFHVGGLATDGSYIYASDFDNRTLLKINVERSFKENKVIATNVFNLEVYGASGLSVNQNILAVSDYIVPYRSPYLKDRFIKFYDLSTGLPVHFEGDLKSSNYSQGLTFFERDKKLYLAESINMFNSILKYRLTGLDDLPDAIRIYSVDVKTKKIKFLNELSIPAVMVEDLGFDGEHFYTTDEQDFHFYKGTVSGKCS